MATINQVLVNDVLYDIEVNAENVVGEVDKATVSTKVGTADKGSATQPIYLKAGVPTIINYDLKDIQTQIDNLGKSVADGKTTLADAISEYEQADGNMSFSELAEAVTNGFQAAHNDGRQGAMVGTAVAAEVLTGKTFTNANGVGITGTMPDLYQKATITYTSSNNTKVLLGDNAFLSTNSDGVERAQIRYQGDAGKLSSNMLFGVPTATMRAAVNTGTDATAAHILSGKKAYNSSTLVTGTMTNNGAISKSITPSISAQSYTVPAGYHNGSGKVTIAAVSATKTLGATNGTAVDMGGAYRYVNTNAVYNSGYTVGYAAGGSNTGFSTATQVYHNEGTSGSFTSAVVGARYLLAVSHMPGESVSYSGISVEFQVDTPAYAGIPNLFIIGKATSTTIAVSKPSGSLYNTFYRLT